MKEHPIIFSASMVLSILRGAKSQTRRLAKAPAGYEIDGRGRNNGRPVVLCSLTATPTGSRLVYCPYGGPGDHLWVREGFALSVRDIEGHEELDAKRPELWGHVAYRADPSKGDWLSYDGNGSRTPRPVPWRSPLYMPRWASRITLEITDVRIEPLESITEADAKAEGVEAEWCDPNDGEQYESLSGEDIGGGHGYTSPRSYVAGFMRAWSRINGKRAPWETNPLVWVIEFQRVESSREVA